MKTDWPTPYTPTSGLTSSEPGYRILGKGEILMKTDEVFTGTCHWTYTNQAGKVVGSDPIALYTYRRALCVDDLYAPPPEYWCHPDWMIVTKPQPDKSMQWWDYAKKSWQSCYFDECAFHDCFYYRRPIGNPPMITSAAPTNDWIPFSVRKPTREEAANGLFVWDGSSRRLIWPEVTFRSIDTHWMPANIPPPPKPTLPPAPKLDGVDGKVYEMVYVKGQAIVSFGCAQIDISLLRDAAKAMGYVVTDTGVMDNCGIVRDGNRRIKSITLDSGISINSAEIKEILKHVDAVNKS